MKLLFTTLILFLVSFGLKAQDPLQIVVPDTFYIGIQGKPYQSQIFDAIGGVKPYNVTIPTILPEGLQFQDRSIKGIPTGPSVTTVQINVEDSSEPPLTASKNVQLVIQHIYGPYATPEAVTICQMDLTQTPPTPAIDESLLVPRCFVVPVAVSDSMTKFMVSQTNGLDSNGNTNYKYASWWDYVVKFFLNKLVLPTLEEFPPPELATAKANAEAAAAAVDAAKISIMQVDPSAIK